MTSSSLILLTNTARFACCSQLGSNVLKFSRQEVQHIIGNGRLNGLSEGKQQQLLEYFKLRGWKSYQAEAASSATDEAGRMRAAAETEYKENVAAEERRVTKLNDKIKKKREEVKAYNAKVRHKRAPSSSLMYC